MSDNKPDNKPDEQEPSAPEPERAELAPSAQAASDGAASDGAASDGAASDGAVNDGAASDGAASDGAASDGAASLDAAGDEAESIGDGAVASESTPEDSPGGEVATGEGAGVEEADAEVGAEDAEGQLPPGASLPAHAGVRAQRRVRPGLSLGRGIWLAALCALLPVLAVLALYLRQEPVAETDVPQGTGLPPSSVEMVGAAVEAQLVAERERLAGMCKALALEIDSAIVAKAAVSAASAAAEGAAAATPGPASAPATTSAESADATALATLKQEIAAARAAMPALNAAIIDLKGRMVHADGPLAADEAEAFSEAVRLLLRGEPMASDRVGAVSPTRPNAYRVALLVEAPSLSAEALVPAQEAEAQLRQRVHSLEAAALARSAAGERAQKLSLQMVLAAAGASLLALLGLWIGVVGPLRRSFDAFVRRTGERAAGREPAADAALPKELATADELVAKAFVAVRDEASEVEARGDQQRALQELAEVCERAAKGDLSARAVEGAGAAGTLAVAINFLVDSFERRALRLRSHAQEAADSARPGARGETTADGDAAVAEAGEAGNLVDELRLRATALTPIAQLLADIAGRLHGYADRIGDGDSVEEDLRRLGDAVAQRTRTARAYLGALVGAVDSVAQERPVSDELAQQIEAELEDLTLDTSFAAQVGALRELGPVAIRKRLESEAKSPAEPGSGAE